MIGFAALTDTSVHDAHRALQQRFAVALMQPHKPLPVTVDVAGLETDGGKIDTQVILVVGVGPFLARAEELTDWTGVVIVFDCPVRCDGLVGVTMLDVKERTESFTYVFERLTPEALVEHVQKALDEDDEVFFHQRKSNMIPWLLSRTSSSQMDRLQTWKYSIKNTELRDVALEILVSWFFNPKPTIDQLKTRLMRVLSLDKSKALDVLFKDNKFEELRAAVVQVWGLKQDGKTIPIDKIAEKAEVSPFDIRYLVHTREKTLKGGDVDPPVTLKDIHLAARNKKPCPLKNVDEITEADNETT